ncbi:MAG: hypothetical protein OEW97_00875, partial [Gammaproteobacteria bacterium]|nr:hypothetical protein [Gammaproteobacteria bacterium]
MMISIGEIPFIILIQSIILLIMLSAVLLFLLHRNNKKIKSLSHVLSEAKETSPLASVEFYLTAEIKLIESRFALLYSEQDLCTENFSEPDWLHLRKGFLEIEKKLLKHERLETLWADVGDNVRNILNENYLVKRIKTKDVKEDDEEETREMKELLKAQYDDFDSMFLALEGEKNAEEVAGLKEKLTNIIRNHTELTHCIYTLRM